VPASTRRPLDMSSQLVYSRSKNCARLNVAVVTLNEPGFPYRGDNDKWAQ